MLRALYRFCVVFLRELGPRCEKPYAGTLGVPSTFIKCQRVRGHVIKHRYANGRYVIEYD